MPPLQLSTFSKPVSLHLINSNHREYVRSLVGARQTHFMQSDRAINRRVAVKFKTVSSTKEHDIL